MLERQSRPTECGISGMGCCCSNDRRLGSGGGHSCYHSRRDGVRGGHRWTRLDWLVNDVLYCWLSGGGIWQLGSWPQDRGYFRTGHHSSSGCTSRQMRSSNVKRGPRSVAADDRHLYVGSHDVMQVTGMSLLSTDCCHRNG